MSRNETMRYSAEWKTTCTNKGTYLSHQCAPWVVEECCWRELANKPSSTPVACLSVEVVPTRAVRCSRFSRHHTKPAVKASMTTFAAEHHTTKWIFMLKLSIVFLNWARSVSITSVTAVLHGLRPIFNLHYVSPSYLKDEWSYNDGYYCNEVHTLESCKPKSGTKKEKCLSFERK